jgi:hypothetical protein
MSRPTSSRRRGGKWGLAHALDAVGLLSYSPELNPAERLFEEIRRHFEGRACVMPDHKVAEVQDFLERLDADPSRVHRHCDRDWINVAIAALLVMLAHAANQARSV